MAGTRRSYETRRAQLDEVMTRFEKKQRRRRWHIVPLAVATVLLIVAIGSAAAGALWIQYRYQQPARDLVGAWVEREGDWQARMRPSLKPLISVASWLFPPPDTATAGGLDPGPPIAVAGPKSELASSPLCYSEQGRPLPTTATRRPVPSPRCTFGRLPTRSVSTAAELRRAMNDARAGDVIELAPGRYEVAATLATGQAGSAEAPIILRAAQPGETVLIGRTVEMLVINDPFWVIENLSFEGCGGRNCEHALHVVGPAENTVVRNNEFRNFNAAIKANRLQQPPVQPDGLLIEANRFTNDEPRQTELPVTPIDIVAADEVRIRGNYVADFAKARSDRVSYGVFVKGGGVAPIIERNYVRCAATHDGGTRVGISLGGGGTAPRLCSTPGCTQETVGGTIRANIVESCSDVGIYLNKAAASTIANNTLVNTRGIDARFAATDAEILNNVLDGRIAERDGGRVVAASNRASSWQAALLRSSTERDLADAGAGDLRFTDAELVQERGSPLLPDRSGLPVMDYCGAPIDPAQPPLGAMEQGRGPSCAAAP